MRTRTVEEKLKDAIFGEGNRLMENESSTPTENRIFEIIEQKAAEIRKLLEPSEADEARLRECGLRAAMAALASKPLLRP